MARKDEARGQGLRSLGGAADARVNRASERLRGSKEAQRRLHRPWCHCDLFLQEAGTIRVTSLVVMRRRNGGGRGLGEAGAQAASLERAGATLTVEILPFLIHQLSRSHSSTTSRSRIAAATAFVLPSETPHTPAPIATVASARIGLQHGGRKQAGQDAGPDQLPPASHHDGRSSDGRPDARL
jgi:hypothetical protein